MNLFTFICQDVDAAKTAALRVGPLRGMIRLFVFLGEPPEEAALSWMDSYDRKIVLAQAHLWSEDPTAMAIRAAMLTCEGLYTFFAFADAPPSQHEIEKVRQELMKSDESASGTRVWGVARDHIVVAGFDYALPPRRVLDNSYKDADPLEIGQGLRGVPVSRAAALAIVRETCPLRFVGDFVGRADGEDTQRALLSDIAELAETYNRRLRETLIIGDVDDETFGKILGNLPRVGAGVRVAEDYPETGTPRWFGQQPFRVIRIKEGPAILLFAGQES